MKTIGFCIAKGGTGKTPLLAEEFSFDGVQIFQEELDQIQKNFRVKLKYEKVILNQVNFSYAIHKKYIEALQGVKGYEFFMLPHDVKVKESQSLKLPIQIHSPGGKFSKAISELAGALV